LLAIQSWVELGIADRQPRAAKLDERSTFVAPFREKTKALERGAVAELIAISDELHGERRKFAPTSRPKGQTLRAHPSRTQRGDFLRAPSRDAWRTRTAIHVPSM
jgi:hypothetical protein